MRKPVHDPFDERYLKTVFIAETDPASLWASFAIVTGCNPEGKCIAQHDNDVHTLAMLKRLVALGFEPIRIDGCSPDEQHREASFAVPCDSQQARQICLQYAQLAFYMVEDRKLSLHDVGSERFKAVGIWTSRLRLRRMMSAHEI